MNFCPIHECDNTADLTPFEPVQIEITTVYGHRLTILVDMCRRHASELTNANEPPAVAPV